MPTCTVHTHVPETAPCAGCSRPFCAACLAPIMGQLLCEECKRWAVQGMVERPRAHPLAAPALVVPAVGYLLCVMIPITSSVGLYLSRRVLRELAAQPHLGGRGAALAGLVLSAGTLAAWVAAALCVGAFYLTNRG